ncbi:MAG: N-acetylmuramoyl-L-alanine amidase family protein [Lachnospiraceae bacterium]|nr:N-acetylmuramoyl-L-alanine amidase family protein [Lachnospiraceae bacterium]
MYPIWVAGTQITEENREDVLGDGMVRYVPETQTLEIEDADLYQEGCEALLFEGIDLTVEGTATFTACDYAPIRGNNGSLTMVGVFTTVFESWSSGGDNFPLTVSNDLHVKGGTLSCQGIDVGGNLLIDGEVMSSDQVQAGESITVNGILEASAGSVWTTMPAVKAPVIISSGCVETFSSDYGIEAESITVSDGTFIVHVDSLYFPCHGIQASSFTVGNDITMVEITTVGLLMPDESGEVKEYPSRGALLCKNAITLGDKTEISVPEGAGIGLITDCFSGEDENFYTILEADGTRAAGHVVICPKQTLTPGWHKDENGWKYVLEDGTYSVNRWEKIGGKWYHFDADGYMQTGWLKLNNKWYYLGTNGAMVTGWKQVNGKWYYFNAGGDMVTNWKKINDKWYYFNAGGDMVTGWKTIGGKTYFFKTSGAMAASEWCGGWWLNGNGTWTYPYKATWRKNAKGWWFGDESGWYAKNCTITIDGKSYTFDAKGYMQ